MDTNRAAIVSLILILSILRTVIGLKGDINDRLETYTTLHHRDLRHHIVKRSATSEHPSERIVHITVFGRYLKLNLYIAQELFTNDIIISSVDSHAKEHKVDIDLEQFYHGYVTGEEDNSEVHAYFEDQNIVAQIKLKEGTLFIEPSLKHLPKSDDYSMISYWAADFKTEKAQHPDRHLGASFCGFVHPEYDEANYTENKPQEHRRQKRDATVPVKNTCPLMLVSDYKFFKDVGQSNRAKTAAYLIELVDRIDNIYRSHTFGSYSGVGFEIKGILIHEAPTPVSSGQLHYNMAKSPWNTKELLKEFSKNDWSEYCLAHLFTSESFSDGVLGLGWIAKDAAGSAGGICSPNAGGVYYSTAWSSSKNKYNKSILTQEAQLVTAHEFGHNWGSQHDPETKECSPGSRNGGKFIMYTYSVSGYEPNNDMFSPCSALSIGSVLQAKSSSCFTERNSVFCGNYKVESDEQCDTGGVGDACCTKQCRFKTGAECSDANDDCCQGCKFSPSTVICSGVQGNTLLCEGSANCTGNSPTCGSPKPKDDGVECFDHGKCRNGKCRPFCESVKGQDLMTCICDEIEDSCKFCCKSSPNGTCSPYPTNLTLADGKPCVIGYCLSGKCKQEITDLTDRLWNIIESLSVNNIIQWMRSNIVTSVVVLSLLLFIPICIIVSCVDHRREKEEEDTAEWLDKNNTTLVRSHDSRPVERAFLPHKRPSQKKYISKETESIPYQRHRDDDDVESYTDRGATRRLPPIRHITVSEHQNF